MNDELRHRNPTLATAPLALQTLVSRAYLDDPVRTDRELRELGFEALARELAIDHQTGRLRENQATLEPGYAL